MHRRYSLFVMVNESPVAALCDDRAIVANNIVIFCVTCNLHYRSCGTHGAEEGGILGLVSKLEGKGSGGF